MCEVPQASNEPYIQGLSELCAVTIVSRALERGTKLPNSGLGMIFIAVNRTDWTGRRTTAANGDECAL